MRVPFQFGHRKQFVHHFVQRSTLIAPGFAKENTPVRSYPVASLIQRNGTYYITDRLSGKIVRRSQRTDSVQIAKEKLRQYQSAQLRGEDIPLPTRTSIAQVVGEYVRHIRTFKTGKSAHTDTLLFVP